MISRLKLKKMYSNHPASQPIGENLTKHLPDEVLLKIFSYLGKRELERCERVSNRWWQIASDRSFLQFGFGKKMWENHIAEIGNEPPLPKNIRGILETPCPIFGNGKKIKDTHILVLIPETVLGIPVSLNVLEALFPSLMENNQTFCCYSEYTKELIGNKTINQSYWVLMAKDVIPNSLGKVDTGKNPIFKELPDYRNSTTLEAIVKELPNYRIPTTLEATICILTRYVATEQKLFNYDDRSLIYCQEIDSNSDTNKISTVVGNFCSKGLNIHSCVTFDVGIAPLRVLDHYIS